MSLVYMRLINKIHTHIVIYSRPSPLLRVTTGDRTLSCSFRSPVQIKCHVAIYAKNSFDRANIRSFTNRLFAGINTFFFEISTLDTQGVMNGQHDTGSVIRRSVVQASRGVNSCNDRMISSNRVLDVAHQDGTSLRAFSDTRGNSSSFLSARLFLSPRTTFVERSRGAPLVFRSGGYEIAPNTCVRRAERR